MDSVYLSVALVTAGFALMSGTISLFAGLHRGREKPDVLFGLLSIFIFLFLILPPVGFITKNVAPYSSAIIIKRIFIWGYYLLLSKFIEAYSGYRNRLLSTLIFLLAGVSYLLMTLTRQNVGVPLWGNFAGGAIALIFCYGIVAGIYQLKNNQAKEGKWLLWAMGLYGALFLGAFVTALRGGTNFSPLHLNMLAFIAIMSLRMRVSTQEKFRLEKVLNWRETRWNLLVKNMQLMIVELDKEARITYLNPYSLQKLGYASPEQLLGRDWFDSFAEKEGASLFKSIYTYSIQEKKPLADFTSHIRVKNGKKLIINWTNVFLVNPDDSLRGIMSIGMDNTELVSAFEQVQALKNELEKENLLLRSEKTANHPEPEIVGRSEAFQYAIQKSNQVAETNATVLLLGETGSGKELFADLIQRKSNRFDKPFIKVNCAALPAELIESELFGHEKGAFTGAGSFRKGKFELADTGTIFLDEIGELPVSLQSKLLRILQSAELERIGGQGVIRVDVRVISATNRNLAEEVRAGKFREDLYYRLNVFPITVPPLRQRREDIPLLVSHFVQKFSAIQGKSFSEISRADNHRLSEYDWPGNIRELINLVERSVIECPGPVLHLIWDALPGMHESAGNVHTMLEEVEKAHILKILDECKWKINGEGGAASKLGLHPNTLRSRLKKLQIDRSRGSEFFSR
jgi:PAS domain S-box-containing protein